MYFELVTATAKYVVAQQVSRSWHYHCPSYFDSRWQTIDQYLLYLFNH